MTQKNHLRDCKRVNKRKDLKEYTYLGCPLTKNRSPWCFKLCKPDTDGTGFCGRIAPHGIKSRIQLGIESYNKRQTKSATSLTAQDATIGKET